MSDEAWRQEVQDWKSKMEVVVPELQKQGEKHETAIFALQQSQATEEMRTRQVVSAVLKSGEFRLKNWMTLVTGLAGIGAILYGVFKP